MLGKVSAIIVTHNSGGLLFQCLDSLKRQTFSFKEIILVDCGSDERSYLNEYRHAPGIVLIETDNIGFSKANNLGLKALGCQPDFLFFLNPDTFLLPSFVEQAVGILSEYPEVGIVSGKLLGYDFEKKTPTQRIDSTGIFRKWYGRWYDRGQGQLDCGMYGAVENVPALCGALLCCRYSALKMLPYVFDPDFFLYKEDIELCLRLRKRGWQLLYHPELIAFHCRGWNSKRSNVPFAIKKMAALNEILLYKKHPSPYMLWALLKYLLVRGFRF
jgi:GT2 family glycosyltransferase